MLTRRLPRGNPYVAPDGGLRSYRASVVTLQIDPTRRDSDERVAIGVINVMQTSTFDPESAKNVGDKVLKQLTRMLERQLRSTWDGAGRLRAAKARAVVSELTERVLVHNHGLRTEEADDLSAKHARLAVEKIEQVLLRAGAVTVVDLRGIVARVGLGQWCRPVNGAEMCLRRMYRKRREAQRTSRTQTQRPVAMTSWRKLRRPGWHSTDTSWPTISSD